jgi:uncharacterized protein (DUF1330 family)
MSAYVLALINVKDREGYDQEFQPLARELLKAAGAEFLVGDDNPKVLMGETTNRVVITKFNDMTAVDNWSSGFNELWTSVGAKYADCTLIAVKGATEAARTEAAPLEGASAAGGR